MNFSREELIVIYQGLGETARFYRQHAKDIQNYKPAQSDNFDRSGFADTFIKKANECEAIRARIAEENRWIV